MAYRINDEIFFLKIDEQVEYLTQVINELYAKDIKVINTNINNLSAQVNNLNETKQDKTSDELKTEVKNIVGSINELFDKIESETNRAVNSENEISTNLTEYENHVNPILDSHTSSISSINDSIRSLQDNKQSKIDEQLQTTSKEIVGAINENHDAIVTNEALIDTKQDKTDNSLETTNKTIVGAINEVNNKIFTDENIDEIKKELNNKANKTDVVNKSDIINTHVGFSTTYPMSQSAVKNNFWQINPIDSEVGPSKPAVSNILFKTGFYVTVPTDNTSIPPAWDSNYDPCPGGTGYGSLLNLVNNGGALGSYRQQAQLYFADEPKNVYWRFDFNGQNHSDTANWGGWKRLVNYDEISSGVKLANSNSSSITFYRIDSPASYGMTILTGLKEFVEGPQDWTLPQTMKNASYTILLNPHNSSEPSSSYYNPNIYNQTTTSCTVYSSKRLVYAYAIICTW